MGQEALQQQPQPQLLPWAVITTGAAGTAGASGAPGASGASGAAGASGASGAAGAAGASEAAGASGSVRRPAGSSRLGTRNVNGRGCFNTG